MDVVSAAATEQGLGLILSRLIGHRKLGKGLQSVIEIRSFRELKRVYSETVKVVHLVAEEIPRCADFTLKA